MREKDNLKTLDFIVIGASKSGTTSLFNYLRTHPQIYLPPDKDAPFFAVDEWSKQGWVWAVQEFFEKAPIDTRWGTVTPRYMENLSIPERIFKVMPQVKLIAILRNPVDRMFSHYRQQVRRNKEVRSFEIVVHEQLTPKSVEQARLPTHFNTISHCNPVRSEYSLVLHHYLSYFPPGQLLVLFTEDLKQRPQFVLDTIYAFIGLSPGFSPPNLGQQYHIGGTRQRFPWLIPVVQKIRPLRGLWQTLPKARRRAVWTWFFTQINVIPETPPQLSPDLRRRLVTFFQPDVFELETLIGQKVPWQEFHAKS